MNPVQIKCINTEVLPSEIDEVESIYDQALDRFNHFIREAQITLRDINGPKGGIDKLCTIQLRFFPRGLAVIKSSGITFSQAACIACDKMQQVTAKRLSKRKGGPVKNSQSEYEGGYQYGS